MLSYINMTELNKGIYVYMRIFTLNLANSLVMSRIKKGLIIAHNVRTEQI